MSLEVDFSLELLLAEAAGERLVAAVFPHVRDQVGRLTEPLVTHDATMRLLS